MYESLLSELNQYVAELEVKEAAVRYTVPEEVMKTVKKAKSLEKLLHEIFMQVSGNGGILLGPILRREFGMNAELVDHFEQWAPYSKDEFEDELHDAIDRAEIRAGNQGVFFMGTPSKKESAEALQLLKDIAHAAVKLQFHGQTQKPELHVVILDKLLQFYALPSTYPEGNDISFRNLISSDRFSAVSGGDGAAIEALKSYARSWYQQSGRPFLERMEGYPSHEFVSSYLYALTSEQLARLQDEYIGYIMEEFGLLKKKPDLHRAKLLKGMLETILSWSDILIEEK